MKDNMISKHKIAAAVVIVVMLISLGTVLAYLYMRQDKTNTVYVGKGNAEITESFEKPVKLDSSANIYQKEVSVTNTGLNPCFVRVYMDFSDSSVEKISFIYSGTSATQPNKNDENWKPADGTDWLPSGWVKHGDYYYYTQPIESGASTAALMQWVQTVFSDTDKPRMYEILIYSETVQTIGADGTNYGSKTDGYKNAWREYLRTDPFTT